MPLDDASNAAILFEPDGYVLDGPKLMGRQAAGNAFLRAAVAGLKGQTLWAYTPHRRSAERFRQLVSALDPQADGRWIPADRLDLVSQVGTLYLPGPGLAEFGRLRLRAGSAAYSLVGVTHTTASHVAMDAITGLLAGPVMPWDALICTSRAVGGTVKVLLEAEIEYLRWRFGPNLNMTLPQLPVIPLGVHCADFEFTPAERASARQALGIAEDEVVALFVGRLSFHAKAHPYAMYRGLQVAVERTGRKVTLLQCGWFANEAIERSFADGAAQFCPGVRALFGDGRDTEVRKRCWAAADLFISLSDNIQETFGLSPIEAMAAGLPLVVSDWDGYKDTVRDGVDGFRIATWMPPPGLGAGFAHAYSAGTDNYDFYCGLTCQTVSLDMQALCERLADLVAQPELRLRLGAAGRERARADYDWAVVFRRYQELWSQLATLRVQAAGDAANKTMFQTAPKVTPSRLDPFLSFAHYATRPINSQTSIQFAGTFSRADYEQIAKHGLFAYAARTLPSPDLVEDLFKHLADGPLTAAELGRRASRDIGVVVMAIASLAKMGLVRLDSN